MVSAYSCKLVLVALSVHAVLTVLAIAGGSTPGG